jgi:hypothetical protein
MKRPRWLTPRRIWWMVVLAAFLVALILALRSAQPS